VFLAFLGLVVPKGREITTILRCIISQKSEDLMRTVAEARSHIYTWFSLVFTCRPVSLLTSNTALTLSYKITPQSTTSAVFIYRIFSNLIRTSFCRFLKQKKKTKKKSKFAVLIRTFPSTAPCLQGRLIESDE
jgi:hypothetical protein